MKGFEDMEVTWKVTDFFSKTEDKGVISSPSFIFADATWHIHLHLKPVRQNLRLYLIKNGNLESLIRYVFGLRKKNGFAEYLSAGFMKEEHLSNICLINMLTIEQRKSELAPSGTLSIMCRMKRETNFSGQERMLEHSSTLKKLKSK